MSQQPGGPAVDIPTPITPFSSSTSTTTEPKTPIPQLVLDPLYSG